MKGIEPYNESDDRRAGASAFRHGLCSRTWCREPAEIQWKTKHDHRRYACAEHRAAVEQPDDDPIGLGAAGAGDGVYHDAPYLKKYGA